MATISENLEALKTAKTSIKSAIEGKGQDLTNVPFTQYGEKIADIQTKEDLDPELNEQDELLAELQSSVEELPEKPYDMLQQRIDAGGAEGLLYYYKGTDLEFLKNLDTSNVTDFKNAFAWCVNITNADGLRYLNTSNATSMASMFYRFGSSSGLSVLDLSFLDTSQVTEMSSMFSYANTLTEVTGLNTSNVQTMSLMFNEARQLRSCSLDLTSATMINNMFSYCEQLREVIFLNANKLTNIANLFSGGGTQITTFKGLDLRNITSITSKNLFAQLYRIETLVLKNIKASLQIGSGTTYGHLLTLDSLLNTIQELWTNTGTTTLTLTMGTANTAKLTNVYVKLIDITDDIRAEDEYIDNKAPFVQCESTDDGAMLITEYVTTVKKWQLA